MASMIPSGGCPDDEALAAFALGRLDEAHRSLLEVHLDACETCLFLVADVARAQGLGVAHTAPLDGERTAEWSTTFSAGTLVGGRYSITRFIARGMGEVYEAVDRILNERVALKTVTATSSDDVRAVRRLKAEVQLARRVSHPNVCRIYDLGTHSLGEGRGEIHFITMQFVEGETLGQRLRLDGALPADEALDVTRELLYALRAAHEAGVLHRDLKSDNVMLRAAPDGQASAVVLDFGLARGLDRDNLASASNPNIVGTPGYIAPEQYAGMACSIASDIFSFGVVWYEMLTGQMPSEAGASPRGAQNRLLGEVPPPSEVNPEVPKWLDALVLRCLEQLPDERYRSVGALIDALEAVTGTPGLRRRRVIRAALFGVLGGALLAASMLVRAAMPATSPVVASEQPGSVPPGPPNTHVPEHLAAPAPDRTLAKPPVVEHPGPFAELAVATAGVAAGVPPSVRRPSARHERSAPAPSLRVLPALPADSAPPAETAQPPRPAPRKPDWENPFGANDQPQLLAGAHSPT
jgi:hypothetical protein